MNLKLLIVILGTLLSVNYGLIAMEPEQGPAPASVQIAAPAFAPQIMRYNPEMDKDTVFGIFTDNANPQENMMPLGLIKKRFGEILSLQGEPRSEKTIDVLRKDGTVRAYITYLFFPQREHPNKGWIEFLQSTRNASPEERKGYEKQLFSHALAELKKRYEAFQNQQTEAQRALSAAKPDKITTSSRHRELAERTGFKKSPENNWEYEITFQE